MSAKWQRTKSWDRRHLRGPVLAPVGWVLHAFSSIWLAVILLTLVSLYGVLASVPIGMLALAPTWAVYGLTLVVPAGLAAGLAFIGVRTLVPPARAVTRLGGSIVAGIVVFSGVCVLWAGTVWPAIHFDPADGSGLRFFAEFVRANESITLRRLPGIEMTELEFYSAWPLRVLLLLFVVNMFVATVRRIEFSVKNAGVLTVHTGMMVIALGGVYYQALKREGDTILMAGEPEADGVPGRGPAQSVYYDGTRVVISARQRGPGTDADGAWDHRVVRGMPRYNAYGVHPGAHGEPGALLSSEFAGAVEGGVPDAPGRTLAIDLPRAEGPGGVDADIGLRVVGYAPYASLREDVRLYTREEYGAFARWGEPRPVREVEVRFPPEDATRDERAVLRFTLMPDDPIRRGKSAPGLAFDMTRAMEASRWADLTTAVPAGSAHGLIVEIPGAGARVAIPGRAGEAYSIGRTGWEVAVRAFVPEPPLPIVTAGYEGASSSVAVLRITSPEGAVFDRWVYSRFPELNQDVLAPSRSGGRPTRRNADPAIRVGYVEVRDQLRVHIDEVTSAAADEPRWRVAVRAPDGSVRTFEGIAAGEPVVDAMRGIDVVVGEGWAHGDVIERPIGVADIERESQFIGTHDMAKAAVEVSVAGVGGGPGWTRVVWVPFTRYAGLGTDASREVTLPDGRRVTLAFGRLQRRFPGFALRLVDFEMVAYDHRGAPRDYQSRIEVVPSLGEGVAAFGAYERIAQLNAPLRAPFVWEDGRSWVSNAALRVTSGLNPNQYKISQAGWDQSGWTQTQALADRGTIPEPYARFTIMQVGNNPGVHVIAVGGIMMALGIPWAFYVKPWLVRRERARLAAALGR